jgi:hypothetical protein
MASAKWQMLSFKCFLVKSDDTFFAAAMISNHHRCFKHPLLQQHHQ